MPKARSEHRDKALAIYLKRGGEITNREIARILGVSEKTVSGWKCKDKWPKKVNGVLQSIERSTPKKRGAQLGNKNATGPPGNQNARKHGLFSKYLPAETKAIIDDMPLDPLDMLWDQIQLSYAAIIRAQQLMYVKDQDDKTIEKVEEKDGNVIGERWEVQQAWDKHAGFITAQSRAQTTLRGLINQYDEMLHKNWKLASAEQKARIKHLKAQTMKISGDDPGEIQDDGFLEALNATAEEDWLNESD